MLSHIELIACEFSLEHSLVTSVREDKYIKEKNLKEDFKATPGTSLAFKLTNRHSSQTSKQKVKMCHKNILLLLHILLITIESYQVLWLTHWFMFEFVMFFEKSDVGCKGMDCC